MVSERCGKQSKLIKIIQYIPKNREAVSDFFYLLRYWLLGMKERKGKVTLVKSTLAYTKAVKLRKTTRYPWIRDIEAKMIIE